MKQITLIIAAGTLLLGACTNRKWEEIKPQAPPVPPCDTSYTVSYSAHIAPIMNSSCGATDNNCHTVATSSGGTALNDYTGVSTAYASGQLYGCLTGDVNFSQMPKTGYTLSNCNKTDILRWIKAGAPNN